MSYEVKEEQNIQLKSFAQSTMLPMGTPCSYQDEDSPTLPWPAQFGFKRLLINEKLTPALMTSDLDMAGIAYPKPKEKKLDITIINIAELNGGEVTGVGLKNDGEVIHAINTNYLAVLEEYAEKYKDSLEGDFYKRQLQASIIAAHHGAENLNPYATPEGVEQAFEEGFIFINPKGNATFVPGKAHIFEKLNSLAAEGYYVPISTVWYEILNNYAIAHKKPPLHANILPIDALSHATKKVMTDEEKEAEEIKKAETQFKAGIYFDYDNCLMDDEVSEDFKGYKLYAQGYS